MTKAHWPGWYKQRRWYQRMLDAKLTKAQWNRYHHLWRLVFRAAG